DTREPHLTFRCTSRYAVGETSPAWISDVDRKRMSYTLDVPKRLATASRSCAFLGAAPSFLDLGPSVSHRGPNSGITLPRTPLDAEPGDPLLQEREAVTELKQLCTICIVELECAQSGDVG